MSRAFSPDLNSGVKGLAIKGLYEFRIQKSVAIGQRSGHFDREQSLTGVSILRKRFYIMLVARNTEGELLKIPVPMHYLYVFVAGALIGMLTITGMLGSYTRMVVKTQRFNQLRDEQKALKSQYSQLEQIAQENELQAQFRIIAAILCIAEYGDDRGSVGRHWHG